MKKLVTFISFFTFNIIFCQNRDDEKIFISSLINDNILSLQSKENKERIYSSDLIKISLDTLNNDSYYLGTSFKFYKFNLAKNSIEYGSNIEALFNSSYCEEYILAIDSNKNNYKLTGFRKNDIIYFIEAVKKKFHDKTTKDILKFLKNNITDIDFECIYKSFKNDNFEAKCIKPCSDEIRTH